MIGRRDNRGLAGIGARPLQSGFRRAVRYAVKRRPRRALPAGRALFTEFANPSEKLVAIEIIIAAIDQNRPGAVFELDECGVAAFG